MGPELKVPLSDTTDRATVSWLVKVMIVPVYTRAAEGLNCGWPEVSLNTPMGNFWAWGFGGGGGGGAAAGGGGAGGGGGGAWLCAGAWLGAVDGSAIAALLPLSPLRLLSLP
jgi:hypothetical protein